MRGVSIGRSPAAPNPGTNTKRSAEIARHGNRRVSSRVGGSVDPIRREHINNAAVATPISERNIGLVPDDPATLPISWFTEHLPHSTGKGTGADGMHRDHFQLPFESKTLADDMRNVVSFAQGVDKVMLRATELLEKSERKPLNKKEQREVNALLSAGKYNLAQVQRWTSVTRHNLRNSPTELEFITKLQVRLADRHMNLADLMCRYDLDQALPEQSISRADRVEHHLIAADAALKVVRGLAVSRLSGDAKQQLVAVLEDHRAILGKAKDVAMGSLSDSNSSQVLSHAVWGTAFDLVEGKKVGGRIVPLLHRHWDAKAAGAPGRWLPLAHPKITQEQMLQEFVSYQLKKAGVAKNNLSDLEFQFKQATNRVKNERPWKLIGNQLHYMAGGKPRTAHSKITPVGAMAGYFGEDFSTTGVCCGDRMQYTHVPNLARTELTDESGQTLFSALRHGVLDAYDISASTLSELPEQELTATVMDLLFPYAAGKAAPEELRLYYEKISLDGGTSKADSAGKAVANPYDEIGSGGRVNSGPENPYDEIGSGGRVNSGPENPYDEIGSGGRVSSESENPYAEVRFDGGASRADSAGQATAGQATADGGVNANPTYGTIQRATPPEGPPEPELFPEEIPPEVPPRSEGAWESTIFLEAFERPYWKSTLELDMSLLDAEDATTSSENLVSDGSDLKFGLINQQVKRVVGEIRTDRTLATKYASAMRTAASANMAKELAVAALIGDPGKLQGALKGEVVDLNLSSISLLTTPDQTRSNRILDNPKPDELVMLRRQTEALKSLDSRRLSLRVRNPLDDELRTVEVNCKVRTFNFGVSAGAVGRAKHIPSQVRGWDKLMGWSYAMERNNPELRALLGDPQAEALGGDVQEKLTELEGKLRSQLTDFPRKIGRVVANPEFAVTTSNLEGEIAATRQNITTLKETATATKQIWRESSHNKGGQDPYKLVSRLGMVINEMGETLAFNCKSGKDRSGQLDTELKYLTALNAAEGHLPDPDAPMTPELRQMRNDFSLNSGNIEMQRMNAGLPGFEQDSKEVPELANFIDPKMYSESASSTANSKAVPGLANAIAGPERHSKPSELKISDQITYLKKISNTCPEQCAVFAANYFDLECKFKDYKKTHKGQIDIFPPLSKNAPEPNADIPQVFTDGKTEEPCLNYLLKLDKSAIYLMRTGRTNAAGHNQILYSKDNEWFVYDHETSQHQVTSNGSLTAAGRDRMVKEHGTWGQVTGQSSITTVQITKEGARDLIDFIKDCRNEGANMNEAEDIAIAHLHAGNS